MIIIKDLDKLKDLTKNELNVLLELLKIRDTQNNIYFHDDERESIAKSLKISRNSLSKSISSLQKNRNLLTKKNDFYYILDSQVFFSSY